MPKRIGAGIIGTTHAHAVGHLQALRRSENYELLGVAESNADLLDLAKKDPRWADVTWVKEDALLANEKVQVVCIETDPLESLKPALRSVMAGKHTKIDKPPGADLKALETIFEEAVRRHCLVQMGYVYRYNPAFRLAHRVLKDKWLGPIRSVVCQMNDKKLTPEYRKRLEVYPGGQMFELCGHMIDALVWLLGSPTRVSPTLRNSAPGQDKFLDDVLAVFEFESAVAVVNSQLRQSERYFQIFGEEGSLLIDSPDRPQVRLTLGAKHDKYAAGIHTVPMTAAERYVPDLDDLASAIRDNRAVEHFTPEHDLAVHRALLAACGSKP